MFQRLFYGRYGVDALSIFLLFLSVPFYGIKWLWLISLVFLAVVIFRSFSRNIQQRKNEAYAFNNMLRKVTDFLRKITYKCLPFFRSIKKWFTLIQMKMAQRKEYVFVKCPKCKNTLRLPRHKGKLAVTCTVCRNEFIKKT